MHSSAPPTIPGHALSAQDAHPLKETVAQLLDRDNLRFPGAQPVSFAREHLAELTRQEYFMCEKTDGVRVLLFLYFAANDATGDFDPVTFLIDRKNTYYQVHPPLRFPYYKFPNDADKFLFNTLLDGELVMDRYKDPRTGESRERLMFYAFDCLVIDGDKLTERTLDKRLGKMQGLIFQPYANWLQRHHGQPPAEQPFIVKEKKMYPPYSLREMFDNILPSLPHGNDGLVFTCKATPYRFGTDPNILKWKPPHENTIDFKLKLGPFPTMEPDPEDPDQEPIPDYDAPPSYIDLHVQHSNNQYQPFAHLHFTPADWETLKSLHERLDGRIIECYRDTAGRWCFKRDDDGTPRWRDDKSAANHISTVQSVLESIEDPVTEGNLLTASAGIKEAVYRMREEERERARQWEREMAARERESKKRKLSLGQGGGFAPGGQ